MSATRSMSRVHHGVRRVAFGALAALGATAVMASAAAALPADRAYEMVTPTDKGGGGLHPYLGVAVSSGSGDRTVYGALGAFAGSESATLVNAYLAERSWPAWASVGLNPPAIPILQGVANAPAGFIAQAISADFSKAVVRTNAALTPDATRGSGSGTSFPMYVRDVASGTHRLITPAQVPPRPPTYPVDFVGGNADFSEVIIETPGVLNAAAAALPSSARKLYRVTADGQVTLESRDQTDVPIASSAATPDANAAELLDNAVSADGSVVFFSSPTNSSQVATSNLYRRENGVTTHVSESENGLPAPVRPNNTRFRTATPDGRHVLFTTSAALVPEDTNDGGNDLAANDLYMYTHSDDPAVDSNLTLISEDNDPSAPAFANAQGVIGMSDDGSRVYFVTQQQIVAGAPSSTDLTVQSSDRHLYLWEDGEVTYLGSGTIDQFLLPTFNVSAWGSPQGTVSVPLVHVRRARSVPPAAGGMLIVSSADLDPDRDNGGRPQAYLYRIATGAWACVSCPADGSPAPGSVDALFATASGALKNAWMRDERRNLSDDASRAFFDSTSPLVRDDVNGRADVYVWDEGEIDLISTGRSPLDSLFTDASASGDDVFFGTWEQLSGWDDDGLMDLYDARVGGGLPEPPETREPCTGDRCQGTQSSVPGFDGPASRRFEELGDVIAGPPRSLRLRRVTPSQRVRLARGRTVGLRVLVGRAGLVRIAVRAKVGGRRRVVARGRKRAPEAGTVWVRVRLSPPARRVLARGKRLAITVNARSARARESDRATVRLKRPGKRAQRRRAGGRR